MIDFEAIKLDFQEKFGDIPGIVSIEMKQNLIRVLLVSEEVIETESLPSTFTHIPQDFHIGIEYDTLDRVETRKKFMEKEAAIKELIEDVNASTPTQ